MQEKIKCGSEAELAAPNETDLTIEDEAMIEEVYGCRKWMSDLQYGVLGRMKHTERGQQIIVPQHIHDGT